jgi:hypothetical protein
MKPTEQNAADTILEKGVRVKLPAPFFLRLFCREIGLVLRQPKYGTLLYVSRISLKAGFDVSKLESGELGEVHELLRRNIMPLSRIMAVLFLNGKWKIRLFARPVARWLMWKLTPRKMAEIALLAVAFAGYEDFTTTIRLIGAMRMKATAPRNLSHDESGS